MRCNGLLLNMDKTELVVIHKPRAKSLNNTLKLYANGETLFVRESGSFKWLGVDFDTNL
jgi:phage FluMu protein Com